MSRFAFGLRYFLFGLGSALQKWSPSLVFQGAPKNRIWWRFLFQRDQRRGGEQEIAGAWMHRNNPATAERSG